MNIATNAVVSLHVELSDIWGNVLQSSDEPLQYLHGGYGDIFPAVEAALDGKCERDRIEVRLEPEDAYGDYDESLVVMLSQNRFPDGLEVGMRADGETIGFDPDRLYTVTDIADGQVVLDGNHPYAGLALKFSCSVAGVRPATESEIANGSADDPTSVVMRALP